MNEKYLIITPDDLRDGLLPLVSQKEARGYDVVIKNVEDFGNPASRHSYVNIREYVLATQPKILLLVGDYDKTPGYPLTRTWIHNGETRSYDYLSDVYFGMQENDIVPTIPTGRLCTNNVDLLEDICQALVSYPRDPDQPWRRRVILSGWVPEGPDDSNWMDGAGYQCIKEIGSYFDPIMEFEYEHYSAEVRKTIWGTRDSTEDSLKAAINQGALIVRYLGHGDEYGWVNIGAGTNQDDIKLTDVRNLHLGEYLVEGQLKSNWKLPLVISATCLTGSIEHRSFAEEWQTHLKAIGIFAAAQESATAWNNRITQRIFHQIISRQKKRVGDILIDAMKQLQKDIEGQFSSGLQEFCNHTFRMYRYLGDPDTILAVPDPKKRTLDEISDHGPVLATTNDKLLLGWVGTPNHKLNFLTSDDGICFSNKTTLRDTSPASLSLAVFDNTFFVAWTGTGQGNLNVMQSTDGRNWTDKVSLRETSASAPSITVATHKKDGGTEHTLYLSWRGKGNNRLNILRSTDGKNWHDKFVLDETSTSGPSIAGYGESGGLLLAWRGTGNNALNVVSVSEDFSLSNKVTLSDSTNAKPCLVVDRKCVYLAWRGMDSALNVLQSEDGKKWDSKVTFDERCIGGPVLTTFGYHILWSWTGTDGRINMLIQDWRL